MVYSRKSIPVDELGVLLLIKRERPFWFPQEPSGMRDLTRYGDRVVGSAQIRGKKVGEGWISCGLVFKTSVGS